MSLKDIFLDSCLYNLVTVGRVHDTILRYCHNNLINNIIIDVILIPIRKFSLSIKSLVNIATKENNK